MGKVIWYVKQLLPFKYKSTYIENNQRKHTVWRMWFGYCFHIQDTILEG